MAITNAQQAKQIMNEGRPMKKIKGQDHMLAYITPGERDTLVDLGGQETMTPEGILAYPPGMGDPNYDGSGSGTYGGSGGNRDTGSNYGQFDRAVNRNKNNSTTTTPSGDGGGYVDRIQQIAKIEKKKKEARDKGFRETGSQTYSPPSFFQNFKNNLYQGSINRNKVEALRNMSLLDKGLPGFFGKVISGVTGKVPDWAKDMTEEEINEMAADIQGIKDYNQATYNYNLNPDLKGSGSELLGRTFDAQDILDSGEMTQDKYEELFPGPTLPKDDGDGIQDPCKGPNPPAYCFVGIRSAEAATPVEQEDSEDEGLFRRFRAEGGMMNTDVVGGEMDFESARQMYGLGKLVKKVTRSVKKIAKSPIGKAALLYAGTAGLGAFGAGAARAGSGLGIFSPTNVFSNVVSSGKNLGLLKRLTGVGKDGTELFSRVGPLSNLGIGSAILGTSLVAGALTSEQEEEAQQISDETGIDIAEIRANPNKYLARRFQAEGGIIRTNYAEGSEDTENLSNDPNYKGWVKVYEASPEAAEMNKNHSKYLQFYNRKAEGGSMKEPVAKKVMPLLDMDGQEMDLRAEGGFVPIGRMEKADDVPARLSKNEFVFTADAVRNAGEGDVDKGAEVMYNMMKNLESGGDVSEESQGLDGARKMFQTSQRLEEVL